MKKYFGKWFILDIETTGLQADTSVLVAVGLKNEEKEKIFFTQQPSKEIEVLKNFLKFLEKENVESLIGYNILHFDIPYIQTKCFVYDLSLNWVNKLKIFDLLEWVKRFKLKMSNLSYLSELFFNKFNSKSFHIPNFYIYFLEGKEEYKEKIIKHLQNDLENGMLLALKLKNFLKIK